jgi:prepilin-type N-terminal cleavage/methylation domain-containing protein/prepilin-type processing-associated H-X9-DG protein
MLKQQNVGNLTRRFIMPSGQSKRAFTLVELLVVIGIIAVLIAILLPALNKARQASKSTVCLSNLRQMGTAWTMYLSDSKGHLPYSIWHQSPTGFSSARRNDFIWHGFWFGILGDYKVQSSKLLCPEAQDPVPWNQNVSGGIKGAGTAFNAWSGEWQNSKPVGIMLSTTSLNPTNDASKNGYRIGSYGINGNVFFSGGADKDYDTDADNGIKTMVDPGTSGSSQAWFGANITQVKPSTDVPVFFDCVWIDCADMSNGTPTAQPTPPPNLAGGQCPSSANQHWRFLIARHGRAINVCFADGHASRVALEDTYQMKWTPFWKPYALTNLPKK